MDKRSDHELLNEFTTNASEAAFATVVNRHIGLVYSAAFRHVNDAHLAEDVTQAVFVLLARKAGAIPKRRILSGWLYCTARFIARDVVKSEARRRKREPVPDFAGTTRHDRLRPCGPPRPCGRCCHHR